MAVDFGEARGASSGEPLIVTLASSGFTSNQDTTEARAFAWVPIMVPTCMVMKSWLKRFSLTARLRTVSKQKYQSTC